MEKTNPYPEVVPGLYSVYEFKQHGEGSRTGCGRVVPLYVLVRVSNPGHEGWAHTDLCRLKTENPGRALVVKPDTGPLFSFEVEER